MTLHFVRTLLIIGISVVSGVMMLVTLILFIAAAAMFFREPF